ncbi:SMI1/KNR4 family protein [Mesorhizobium delmotii]|uniref:Knr4/Smi1-like domain-containing protein n=1 Tax=Mesorhizobium delmotii TaxID=1631247 RepID=A0A2P9A9N2_9HYPH|nr:SMI1/KNR4 family protein [Mesorhizobium delmotii]SJM27818.1 conserved hypothetical protein [Mesorhizobium delmotii]
MLDGREWFGVPGASAEALAELKQVSPVELPDAYYRLLTFTNGGEGPLPVNPYNLCLDTAAEVMEGIRTRNYGRDHLVGFVIFGGNGGGEFLAFDIRKNSPWRVVMIDMIAGPETAEQVVPDFDAFIELIGREADDA